LIKRTKTELCVWTQNRTAMETRGGWNQAKEKLSSDTKSDVYQPQSLTLKLTVSKGFVWGRLCL